METLKRRTGKRPRGIKEGRTQFHVLMTQSQREALLTQAYKEDLSGCQLMRRIIDKYLTEVGAK